MRALLAGGVGLVVIGLLLIPLPGPGFLVVGLGCCVLVVGAVGVFAKATPGRA